MHLETISFSFFSFLALTSAFFVIYSNNTIYSAFFLILVFINITAILIVFEFEFIALMLLIIYVGAIIILFLFIIMMLNINQEKIYHPFYYLNLIFLISFLFFVEAFLVISKTFPSYLNNVFFKKEYFRYLYNFKYTLMFKNRIIHFDFISNLDTIGQVLYIYYSLLFLIAGLILLIGLIGAIVLTKKERVLSSKGTQKIYQQLSRNHLNAVFNLKKKQS